MIFFLKINCLTFSQVQENASTKLSGFQIGISHTALKEESLNRAVHNGPGLTGDIFLERSNGKSLRTWNMELASGFLKSDFEREASSYLISGSVSFSYLKGLVNGPPAYRFHLGGKVKAASAIEYFDNWDESHFYWITSYSLGADLRFTYSFGSNGSISFEADFPLVSLVSRPPAKFFYSQSSPAFLDVLRDLNQALSFLSPRAYRNISFQLTYFFRNPKKFIPAIFWRFSDMYMNDNGTGQMKYIRHTLGVKYRF